MLRFIGGKGGKGKPGGVLYLLVADLFFDSRLEGFSEPSFLFEPE